MSLTLASAVKAGDVEGREFIYTREGKLVLQQGETIVAVTGGWDMHVWSPWGGVHPTVVFLGFNSKASSELYVTSERVVLIREVDPWREVAGEMTPLGMPTAVAKEVRLKRLKAAGIRQFCVIRPSLLNLVSSTKSTRRGSRLALHLTDRKGIRYAVTYWKTDGRDDEALAILESRFRR